MNIFIGATLGLAVGGASAALVGVGYVLAIGTGFSMIGATGAQTAAMGCLLFNAEAVIFAPFYSVELEPIDWDSTY